MSRSEGTKRKDEKKREILKAKHGDSEDWQVALTELRNYTPQGSHEHVKQLERLNMPKGMTGYYIGDIDALFLEIYLINDCHVQISSENLSEENTSDCFRSLSLVGTPIAIRAAKQRLNDAIRVRSAEDLEGGGSMGEYQTTSVPLMRGFPLRAVWTLRHEQRRPAKAIHEINVPDAWSVISFSNYVWDLVNSNPSRLHRRKAYANTAAASSSMSTSSRSTTYQARHVDAVSKALLKLFLNPSLHPHISNHATTRAIDFLCYHLRIPAVRRIIDALATTSKSHRHPAGHLTTRIFNACLRSASQAGNIHSYTFLLKLMLSRDCPPDWETWASLLRIVHSRSPKAAKSSVLSTMRSKGLLANPQAKLAVASTLVRTDFANWVNRGGSTAGFIEHYDRLMKGKEWLDPSVANNMLAVRASRGQFTDALFILSTLRERGRKPNEVSLNTLVEEAAAQNNMIAVLASMRAILGEDKTKASKIEIEERLYTRLFYMAGHRSDYNLLRVIWRYACLSGHVSWELQDAFEKAIIWYAPTVGPLDAIDTTTAVGPGAGLELQRFQESELQVWKKYAMKAAVGVEDTGPEFEDVQATSSSHPSFAEQSQAREEQRRQLVAFAATVPPAVSSAENAAASVDPAYVTRRQFLRNLVAKDMQVWEKYRPVYNFLYMLEAAVAKDDTWRRAGISRKIGTEVSFRWVLENMVDVPIKPKGRKA